jgi:NADH-quinone oxidoreductase subunit A
MELPADQFLGIGVFIIVGIVFIIVALIAAWVIRPHKPSKEKCATYECGEPPIGSGWVQFRVGYYIYALIFLIFEVEAVFIFPWAAVMLGFSRNHGLAVLGLVDMVIFTAALVIGLVYAWKKGVLVWK